MPASAILLLHMRPISFLGDVAAEGVLADADHQRLRVQLLVDAAAAIVVLIAALVFSIYKPKGVTPYGQRKLRVQRRMSGER